MPIGTKVLQEVSTAAAGGTMKAASKLGTMEMARRAAVSAAQRGMGRYNMMRTMATAGGDAGRLAVNGFLRNQAVGGAVGGAALGAGLNMARNGINNLQNGENPFRGTLGAGFRGAIGGASLGATVSMGSVFLGAPGGTFGRFAGSGAMGQFYRGRGGRALLGMAREDTQAGMASLRGLYRGARGRVNQGMDWVRGGVGGAVSSPLNQAADWIRAGAQ